jgi:hypothetical protein
MGIRLTITLTILIGAMSCKQKESVANSAEVDKWFIAKFYPLCNDSVSLDIKEMIKHGKLIPYDIVELVSKDSVTISFDFITECCLTFSGYIDLNQDTLFLKYIQRNFVPCDCYCSYRMIYQLDKRDRHWKAIKILNE